MKRSALKSSQPKRDWTKANSKREEGCRFFGVLPGSYGANCEGPVELAHVIGRYHDRYPPDSSHQDCLSLPAPWVVEPNRVFPACRRHHNQYDARELDALPILTVREQAQAVLDAGGLELARNRICGGRDV